LFRGKTVGGAAGLLEVFVELARGAFFVALAVAFLVLAWMFLRLARIFSTTEKTMKEVSEQVVPLIGKTHVTVDNINSQLSQLDEAVGDVAGITDELDQTTTVITRGVRGGVIKVSSATAGLSRGISAFFGGSGAGSESPTKDPTRTVEPPKEGS
jgi:hypothetical protein